MQPPAKINKLWLAVIAMICLDFATTFVAINTGKGIEQNPFVASLWEARDYPKLILFTFIITPFTLYGVWTFWGRKNFILLTNIAFYSFIVASNALILVR